METETQISIADAPLNQGSGEHITPAARTKGRFPLIAATIGLGIVIAGVAAWHFLGDGGAPAGSGSADGQGGPIPVTVETVTQQKLRLWNQYSGRLRAVDSADIRPEVSGRITEVCFKDGQFVNAGDVLVVIEPEPYQAAVARAQARIAVAKANLSFAASEQTRNMALLHTRVIAQREFDQTDSANGAAAAELQAAEADLKTVEVDLDHAYVKAPISGRVSRAELTVGNLVQSGPGAPLLTSIVSENGVYADFEVDEQTYMETIRDAAYGNAQESRIPVEVIVPGGRVYKSYVQNFDNKLDVDSGTIRARVRCDNADGTLAPGMFVSVRLASSREHDVKIIPDRAISFDQSKDFVFVVTPENKVAYREVELGNELGGERVVLQGLAAGERVIVDGVQRVRADAIVAPTEVPAATAATEIETAENDGALNATSKDVTQ